jgi:amphiphysin
MFSESRKWLTDFTSFGRKPEPRSFHSMTTIDDRVVIFGGLGVSNQHLPGIHVFDMSKRSSFYYATSMHIISSAATKEWMQPEETGEVPAGRASHSAVVANGKFIIFGGASHFSPDAMQCTKLYSEVHSIKTGNL